jgi:hypothetical protein
MPLPLPIAPLPPAWEMFIPTLEQGQSTAYLSGLPVSVDGWNLPLALLRPLAPLFGGEETTIGENFLAGLQAENVLGTGILPAMGRRSVPLAWIGVGLREGGRQFNNLRGGCWVCGFPAVGKGKELLRSGDLEESSGLKSTLQELGQADAAHSEFYFNFHYDQPATACERVYVLEAGAGRLHGFAFPPSALAATKLK